MSDLGGMNERDSGDPERAFEQAQAGRTGGDAARVNANALSASDLVRWKQWMEVGASHTAHVHDHAVGSEWNLAALATLADDIAASLAACTAPRQSDAQWSFTLEFKGGEPIDGDVLAREGRIHIDLRPRNHSLARFLAMHRDRLEAAVNGESGQRVSVHVV